MPRIKFVLSIVLFLLMGAKSWSQSYDFSDPFGVSSGLSWQYECQLSTNKNRKAVMIFQNGVENAVVEGLQRLHQNHPELSKALEAYSFESKIRVKCTVLNDSYSGSHMSGILFIPETIRIAIPSNAFTHLEDLESLVQSFAFKSTVFHEFLHSAGIDNRSTSDHNRAQNRELDTVYACTAEAYPSTLKSNTTFKTCQSARLKK